jgi:tetratricopeptide (TPR) repeat protein
MQPPSRSLMSRDISAPKRPPDQTTPPPPRGKSGSLARVPVRGAHGKTKILVMAANPDNRAQLRLAIEIREIEAGLRAASQRDRFQLVQRLAVRPRDLQQSVVGEKPQIVHFCGHGSSQGDLVLEDDRGNPHLVSPEALANLFELSSHFVECVVLNACHTALQAEAIGQHIPYVISMSKAISDQAAIRYAVGFYDALGAGLSYDYAHSLGCSLLRLENIPEHLTPVLRVGRTDRSPATDFAVLGRMSRDEINGVIQQYKATVAAGAEDGETHLSLGLLYLQLRLYDLAIRHCRRAIDLDPGNSEAQYYLALTSIRGRRPKALTLQEVRAVDAYVSAAVELDDRPAKYYYLLGIVRYDYYTANGLSSPIPSGLSLLDTGRGKEQDDWEVERLLSSITIHDTALLARIR